MKSILGLLLIASTTSLVACGGGGDTKYVEKQVPVIVKEDTVLGTSDSDPNNTQFLPLATKVYDGTSLKVVIQPNREDLQILSVTRKDNLSPESEIVTVPVHDSSEVVDTFPGDPLDLRPWNQIYAVTMMHKSFDESQTFTLQILQKKDLTVEGSMDMSRFKISSNELDLGTLRILPESILTLDMSTLKINADSFIGGAKSVIQTMTSADSALATPPMTPGKDGGTYRLNFENADGELHVFLRGGKGGKGQVGAAATGTGAQGSKGKPAVFFFQPIPRPGREVLRTSPRNGVWRSICLENPGNGQPGGQGPQGGRGGAGARGGHTGSLDLHIKSGSLQYSVTMSPGVGGDGGEGGNGGPGGQGGDPGNAGPCPAASAGPAGPTGPKGPQGPAGLDGQYGSFCPSRASTSFSCSNQSFLEGVL